MRRLLSASLALLATGALWAQNPIIRTSYTPDPAPYAHGDKLYLAVDHDEDDATYFKMKDWQLYCTEDMANWTYLGTPVSTATFFPMWCSDSTDEAVSCSDGSPPVTTTHVDGQAATCSAICSSLISVPLSWRVSQKGQWRLHPDRRMKMAAVPVWYPSP